MKRAEEVRAEHKLDTITHYLLNAFPGAAIVSYRAHRGIRDGAVPTTLSPK